MRSRTLRLAVIAGACLLPLGAQMATRRATMTGTRGDRGKCTIEVEVDSVAEVEVSGDSGRIRTLAGQPSTWRRMECSDPLPRNPEDFRFKGIDGRGRVELVADPRSNRGVAVVRIDDSKGGREGYTFDLEWTGRATDSGRLGRDDRFGEGRRGYSGDVVEACRDAVRNEIRDKYNVADVDFDRTAVDDNSGRRDVVIGTASARRSRGGRERYEFECTLNSNNLRVRDVRVRLR